MLASSGRAPRIFRRQRPASLQVVVNDRMAGAVRSHPDRFEAFATVATPALEAAELERAVAKIGLLGGDGRWAHR